MDPLPFPHPLPHRCRCTRSAVPSKDPTSDVYAVNSAVCADLHHQETAVNPPPMSAGARTGMDVQPAEDITGRTDPPAGLGPARVVLHLPPDDLVPRTVVIDRRDGGHLVGAEDIIASVHSN
ncbi:hypothetical protein chiPu_0028236 [Chiloscyllium punctatum]|uniref:Uncharacterized protein n=1 Tax=Chiloscyllium punctatum TaxID=137246 RepID=A0A401TN32_CHIPU|nr:hypothetical protein [Chiloscyllium punctatum]